MVELTFKQISSRENPTYKKIRALRESRKSHQAGLILVEGFRQVEEAIAAGLIPQWFLSSAVALQNERWPRMAGLIAGLLEQHQFECLDLDERLFADLVSTKTPQGVAFVAQSPFLTTAGKTQVEPVINGLYLVLESIQDPGNLGTLIRTADAFAFDGVILTGSTADPYNDKSLRAAMGSTFHLQILQFTDIEQVAHWLNPAGIPLIAADLAGEELNLRTLLGPPAAMMIGNEGAGLSPQAIRLAGRRLKIAMPGRAESLNAAAAAAIFCHHLSLGRDKM